MCTTEPHLAQTSPRTSVEAPWLIFNRFRTETNFSMPCSPYTVAHSIHSEKITATLIQLGPQIFIHPVTVSDYEMLGNIIAIVIIVKWVWIMKTYLNARSSMLAGGPIEKLLRIQTCFFFHEWTFTLWGTKRAISNGRKEDTAMTGDIKFGPRRRACKDITSKTKMSKE